MTDTALTPSEISPIAEMCEVEAWSDLFAAASSDLSKRYGIRSVSVGSATVTVVERVDLMLLNRAVGLGVLEPATEAQVDSILGQFRSAKRKRYAIQLSPYAQPDKLPAWIQARGLAAGSNWAIAFRDAQPPPDARTDLRLQEIGTELMGAFAEIACDIFEIPETLQPLLMAAVGRQRWRHYLAFDDVKPVATAALFVDGNVGWLGYASTLPSHRRRGAQSALLAQRVRDGIAAGCAWFVSECEEETADRPNPSYHNLLRNGFKLAYLRPNYVDRA